MGKNRKVLIDHHQYPLMKKKGWVEELIILLDELDIISDVDYNKHNQVISITCKNKKGED